MANSLDQFLSAQERAYAVALSEIRAGQKQSHWMWYIFPQIAGLGFSETAQYYAIQDLAEAVAYANHPVLGARLVEISEALLLLPTNDALLVTGFPDNLKLCSCMTLFELAASNESVFARVLEKFFDGKRDERTLRIVGKGREIMTSTIEETIQKKLEEIERTQNVHVLYACESGSRAWGFASSDSDYDVRFVYVRPLSDYLRLDKTRDVIEYELNDVYDINGWDVQKLLRLLYKSNPVIFEWADSPIVYRTSADWERIKAVLGDYFSAKRTLYHYCSMAQNNIRSYFKAEQVPLKKYLYVLRPVLACRWILEKQSPPPTAFSALCDAVLPKELEGDVAHLLEVKKTATEKAMGAHIVALDYFLTEQLAAIEKELLAMPKEANADWEKLNALFLELVKE